MARTIIGPERSAIGAPHVNHFALVEVQDTGGTWRNVSTLGSPPVDFLTKGEVSADIDQPVLSGSVTLRRESQGQSLAPLIAASAFNNLTGVYSPLLYPGRKIRLSGAVTLPGGSPAYKLLCLGKIDRVDPHADEIVVEFRDIGAYLLDTWIEDGTISYGSDTPGTDAAVIMQQLIDAYVAGPSLVVVDDPMFKILPYTQDIKSVMEAIKDIALQFGGDVRYRFDAADAFTLQLWQPNRTKSVPDWTIGPGEYDDVTDLSASDSDVRNVIRVRYIDAVTGLPASVVVTSAPSITQFGRRFMQITEDASSQINTLGEATAMANAALSDLAAPKADHEIKTKFFWPVALADLGGFTANGVHYDSDQAFGVVSFKHSFENGQWDTTIKVRGAPAAASRGWLTRGVAPGDSQEPAGDPRALALKNFREVRRTPTVVTYGWNALDPDVDAIWAWSKLSPQDVDPPLGAGANEDRLWRDIKTDAPDSMLDNTTIEFDVAVPDFGYVQTWELQPVNAALTRGYSQRVKVLSVPDIPRITDLQTHVGASGLFASITHLNVVDPQALGGTLKAWLNRTLTDDGNPSLAPDGTIAIATTPRDVLQADTWNLTGGGTAQLFDNIAVHPGRGKRVFFEFVNSRGISSGLVVFVLLSTGGIIDQNGTLLDNSINLATQVAASMTLPSVYASLPTTGRPNELAFNSTDGKIYRWTGAAWTAAVPTVDLSGTIATLQIAAGAVQAAQLGAAAVQTANIAAAAITTALVAGGAISTALIAAGAITSTQIGTGAVTTPALFAGAVTAATIATGAVIAGKIGALAITAGELAAGSITTAKIVSGAITSATIASNAITAGTIAAGAVTAGTIAALAVTAGNVAANAITSNELAANSVIAGKIQAAAVTATAIQAGAINTVAIGTIVLSEIVPGSGIIQVGKLRSIDGLRYLDLNATGSNPFLQHPSMSLNADGTAVFSGALSAASGTFAGSITAATGTFSGTIGASLFTASNITLNATDAGLTFTAPSSGAGLHWASGSNTASITVGILSTLYQLVLTCNTILFQFGGGKFLLNGQVMGAGANDSGGTGFKYLKVPNAATI